MSLRDNLIKLLEANASAKDLQAAMTEAAQLPGEPELLRRLALARSFGQSLFRRLSAGLKVRPLAEFAEQTAVESVPSASTAAGAAPAYAIQEDQRGDLLGTWTADSPELKKTAKLLVENFSPKESPIDHMSAQILANPTKGLEEFETLYKKADDRFDISECSLLIQILRTRNLLLTPELRYAWQSKQDYLNSRILFNDDYYRTNAYFERPSLATAFQEFWNQPDYWLMQLYGKGGYGKTMFVRWLIARHAIPTLRVPVARLDFDNLSLASFAAWPWLVLAPIAEQFKTQVEYASATNPFESFLTTVRGFASVLQRDPSFGDAPVDKIALQARADQVPKWFQSALGSRPVLIVIDTAEEPLLHRLPAMRRMMELLEKLRFESLDGSSAPCTGMRLLVSGRYQITARGRLPEIEKRRKDNLAPALKIEPFEDPEAADYLRQKRGMSDEALIVAIVKKSKGNPFSLSLFADLALMPEGLSVKTVRQAPSNEVAYLLDRVILRIPQDQLHWLVRYAVIPRELTFEFVQNVLAQFLPEEASGKTNRDPQNEFSWRALRSYKQKEPWPTTKIGDLKRLWDALCRYASDPSWITVDRDSRVVKLQPEVVEPMRLLLRANPDIFEALHRAAERHFRDLAKTDRDNWSRHMADAMFHRFQWQGSAAGSEWLKCVESGRVVSAQDRANLASVVLSSALLDDRGRPRKDKSGREMVGLATLARAHFEMGYSALVRRIHLGRVDNDPQSPTDVMMESWKHLSKLPPAAQAKAGAASRRGLLDAGVRIYGGKPGGYQMVSRCLARERDSQYRLTAHLLAARAMDYQEATRSGEHLEQAARIAARIRSRDFPPHWVDFRFAAYYRRIGTLESSKRHLARGLEAALPEISPAEHVPELFWRLTATLRQFGQYEEMASWIKRAKSAAARPGWQESQIHFQIALAEAQLALERLRPLDALEILARVEKLAAAPDTKGAWAEAQVEAAALLLHRWDVERYSRIASEEFQEFHSLYGPALADIRKADFYLSALGNYREGALRPPRYHSWEIDSEYASLRLRMPIDVSGLIDLESPPREVTLRVAVDGFPLVFFSPHAADRLRAVMMRTQPVPIRPANMAYLEEFLPALSKVNADARYRIAERFAFCPGCFAIGDWTWQFRHLMPDPANNDPDFPRKALSVAEGLRVFGDSDGALELLVLAEKKAASNLFLVRLIRSAMHRADPLFRFPLEPFVTDFIQAFGSYSHLCGAAALEAAEYCFAWHEFDEAQKYCDQAWDCFYRSEVFSSLRLRCKLLLAQLADIRKEGAAAERHYDDALEMEDQLGSFDWMQPIHEEIAALRAQPRPADVELVEPAARLTLREGKTPGNYEWSYRSARGTWNHEFPADDFLRDRRYPYSYHHHDLLKADTRRYREVFANWYSKFPPPDTASFGLLVTPAGLPALPWEWLFGPDIFRTSEQRPPQSETAKYMQYVLRGSGIQINVNGKVDDPDLQQALRDRPDGATPHSYIRQLRGKHPAPKPRVLLIQRSETERDGSHRIAGVDAARIYEQNDVRIERIAESELANLVDIVQKLRPTIVHLITGFVEGTKEEAVYCELAPSLALSPERLTRNFQKLPVDHLRPAFLVETPLPPDTYNRAQQALLRNAFCTELFEKGGARGVIGTGLYENDALAAFLTKVALTLEARASLRQLYGELIKLPGAFVPPALWTLDPDLPA